MTKVILLKQTRRLKEEKHSAVQPVPHYHHQCIAANYSFYITKKLYFECIQLKISKLEFEALEQGVPSPRLVYLLRELLLKKFFVILSSVVVCYSSVVVCIAKVFMLLNAKMKLN